MSGPPASEYCCAPVIRHARFSTPCIASMGSVRRVRMASASAAVCCGVPSGLTYWPTGCTREVADAVGPVPPARRPTSPRAAATTVHDRADPTGAPGLRSAASAARAADGRPVLTRCGDGMAAADACGAGAGTANAGRGARAADVVEVLRAEPVFGPAVDWPADRCAVRAVDVVAVVADDDGPVSVDSGSGLA